MTQQYDFSSQFQVDKDYYLKNFDFLNWYRYYFIIKEVINFRPKHVLEIGAGSGLVKNCLQPIVGEYLVLDVNPRLQPDIVADIREHKKELEKKFDVVIAADVLEHIPFTDLGISIRNLYSYLRDKGKALITIPHRRSHFLIMTPTYKPHIITVPTGFLGPRGFYLRFIKRKIWIDPDHCWEIGDGKIKKRDVDLIFKQAGFSIEKFQKLLYVDFWVLRV